MDHSSERVFFDQKHKLARRQFFIRTSVIAVAAALGIVGAEAALETTHASGGVQALPLYRLVKNDTGNHFYTTSAKERDDAIHHNGYRYEFVAGYILPKQENGTVPLYRLVKGSSTYIDHFYTTSAKERDDAIHHNGYRYEFVAGYILPKQENGTVPLYRLVKGSSTYIDHFYTTSAKERDDAIHHNGYRYEFVAGYVFLS
ncbi:hypothetical protein KSF_001090 [Reticulibacter mediterranei]|uniref:DUF5648 domain-containing protein n=1 Tax=Reticulibacter mediterranei TaxID=2778369 RepID=A0A8J3IGW9_9CHLR|nr:hypothetical protein [Reticulibacter mediterranei]GHO90061.1 hypothetical protein KSF_001090 [Reticulibacter mediterranei]